MLLVVRFIKYMLLMLTCAPVYFWCIFFFWVQAKYWKQFVEAHMAVNNDDAIKHIFSRCLLNCLYVPLWYDKFFVLYMSPKPLRKEKGPNLQPVFRDKQITVSEWLKYNWKREFGIIFLFWIMTWFVWSTLLWFLVLMIWKNFVSHFAMSLALSVLKLYCMTIICCRRCYIRFIRKVNDKKGIEGQEETRKAFDFMLTYVGMSLTISCQKLVDLLLSLIIICTFHCLLNFFFNFLLNFR